MTLRSAELVIAALGLALLVSLGFYGQSAFREQQWKAEVENLAGIAGTTFALSDFHRGRVRLLVIRGENETPRFSGEKDGPFEVWIAQSLPINGASYMFSNERIVAAYNTKMRYMQKDPKKFHFGRDKRKRLAAPTPPAH